MADDTTPAPTPAPTDPTPTLLTTPAPTDPAAPVPADPNAAPADPNAAPAVKTEAPAPVVHEPLTREQIVLPEGFTLNDERATEFLELINSAELSPQDRANKLIETHTALMQDALRSFSEATVKEIQEQQSKWEDEIKSDPTIGGDKLAPALAKVSKLIDAEGTPGLRQALDATGAGSNPDIVRFMVKIADMFSEGAPAGGGTPTPQQSTAQRMYPGMNP